MAAATETKTQQKVKTPPAPKPTDVLVALYATKKGVGGLHEFQGTKSYFLKSPAGTQEVFRLKAGTVFAHRWQLEQVAALESETGDAKSAAQLQVIGLAAKFLDNYPEIIVRQIIENCWSIPLMEKIFEKADNPVYAELAKQRIKDIKNLPNKSVILNPVDLEV